MIIAVILVFGLLALSDFPALIRQKKWYEVVVLSALYALVFTLASLQAYDVTLPSPVKGAQFLIVDVLKLGLP